MRLLPFAALLLASCSPQTGADGYSFGAKEYTRDTPAITFVEHRSVADLRRAAPASVEGVRDRLAAWSVIRGDLCEVHILDPAVSYQPEWIGHEVTHCIHGRWHP